MALVEAGAWLAGEVFDLGLGEAVNRVMRSRAAAARDILQDELARGEINVADAADKDEAAAMVFEYTEAARQGAARRNLRMLAQILSGALVMPPIYASEFLRWSRILADLTREELIVIAEWHKAFQRPDAKAALGRILPAITTDLMKLGIVASEDELTSILQAVGRTGLLVGKSGWGGMVFVTSPRLDQLMRLVNMEAVLAERER